MDVLTRIYISMNIYIKSAQYNYYEDNMCLFFKNQMAQYFMK